MAYRRLESVGNAMEFARLSAMPLPAREARSGALGKK
jgi:hypothetical protein